MITIYRVLEWDSGHRILGHETRCRHIHGHRYKAEVMVTAPELDSLGRVIDFSVIKKEVGGWVDEAWDHNMLLNLDDPLVWIGEEYPELWQGKEPYLMKGNPTAENMAKVLFTVSQDLLSQYNITVIRIRLYETPGCWADCSKEDVT
jgi:6-pyruvoyltetrahydropterin/6-carboxytetrahydropterin synthase